MVISLPTQFDCSVKYGRYNPYYTRTFIITLLLEEKGNLTGQWRRIAEGPYKSSRGRDAAGPSNLPTRLYFANWPEWPPNGGQM